MDFKNFELLIKKIEEDLGSEFNQTFREERKKLAGLKNLPNQIIFSEYDKDKSEWVYNRGGKKEIQYHIFLRNDELGYGLGINSQRGSFNNDDPAKIANSFGNSFKELYAKIKNILPTYSFKIGSEEQLGKMKEEEFLLFGNSIPYLNNNKLDDTQYQSLISDLTKQFEVYRMVFELNNRKNEALSSQEIQLEEINKKANLLQYKKQIILQGPPGTGKTRLAKELAESFIFPSRDIEMLYFKTIVSTLKSFKARYNYNALVIESVNEEIIYFSGTKSVPKYSFSIKELYDCYKSKDYLETNFVEYPHYAKRSLVWYIIDLFYTSKMEEQCKLIQFHPSYTYEDFVRGILVKPNPDGEGVIYESENKTLGKFAKAALENFLESNQSSTIAHENASVFDAFIENIKDELAQSENHKYDITEAVYLFSADENRFKYKGDNWVAHNKGLNMKFSELKKIIDSGATERQDIKKMSGIEELTRQHSTYFIKIVEKFYEFKKVFNQSVPSKNYITLKNYVLIIDEINRANLSSVLGELIYALEYRGEAVESMYAVDDDNKLILPPNLYIIGTMNTADRSVGHIDYAIRRRFAFVDVLPKDLSEEEGITFDSVLFSEVTQLFETNLSAEFEKKDVQLGHSYFIDKSDEEDGVGMEIRLKYEIKPVLLEYVKDGVLIGDGIKQKIEELTASI